MPVDFAAAGAQARAMPAARESGRAPSANPRFLTFLLAILVAAGLLALIGWQAGRG